MDCQRYIMPAPRPRDVTVIKGRHSFRNTESFVTPTFEGYHPSHLVHYVMFNNKLWKFTLFIPFDLTAIIYYAVDLSPPPTTHRVKSLACVIRDTDMQMCTLQLRYHFQYNQCCMRLSVAWLTRPGLVSYETGSFFKNKNKRWRQTDGKKWQWQRALSFKVTPPFFF